MNERDLNQREPRDEKAEFEPQARPGSRRISFCPTCGRPFVRGTGVLPPSAGTAPHDPESKEYCRSECVPGVLT